MVSWGTHISKQKVTARMWYRLMSKHESEWPYGIPKRDGKEGRGGFAVQPHREVRPGSGLVGIVGNTYK